MNTFTIHDGHEQMGIFYDEENPNSYMIMRGGFIDTKEVG